jgi:hypothetical protein
MSSNSHKVIQYYLDEEGLQRAPTDEDGTLFLDFGTVMQGQTKKVRLYIKNNIEFPVQLEPIIQNGEEDLKVSRWPPIIHAGAIEPVDIVFSPDPDRIKPLDVGFDFRKIILTRT